MSQLKFWYIGFNFLLSFGWDIKSDKRFENCPKMYKKWLISVSERPDARNATIDTGMSFKEISIRF